MSINKPKIYLKIPNNLETINSSINTYSYSYNHFFNKGKNPFKPNNNNFEDSNKNLKPLTSRDIKLSSDKNLIGKQSRNTNLFSKIKKLLSDLQKENEDKNRLFIYKKKRNKKSKKNKSNNQKAKRISQILPQKKVYYAMPKVKNQMQLNHYLINDFKEIDSEQAYVTRSLKYQKMNEELDELVYLKQIKEAEKNGISEKINNENDKNLDFFENAQKLVSFDSEFNLKSINPNNDNENDINDLNQKKKKEKKKNSIFNKNNYDLSLRKLYKENAHILGKVNNLSRNINNSNSLKTLEQGLNKGIISCPSITTRTKNSENENSIIESSEANKINKTNGIKFLIEKKNRNNNASMNNINIVNYNDYQKKEGQKNMKKKKIKKRNLTIDKFALSNKIYNSQKSEFNKYVKNKQKMRGENFAKQIGFLFKEKEKFRINNQDNDNNNNNKNDNEFKGHPKLDQAKLLYQMQLKDIFTNSFKSMRAINEGDQDLDLDNLNKIKQLIKDYEIEMARVMKSVGEPNCIKRQFNKSTNGKFQSTRGIYM